jgi:hypothetical protein
LDGKTNEAEKLQRRHLPGKMVDRPITANFPLKALLYGCFVLDFASVTQKPIPSPDRQFFVLPKSCLGIAFLDLLVIIIILLLNSSCRYLEHFRRLCQVSILFD